MEPRVSCALALGLLLAAPSAFAGWSAKGALEPDTVFDAASPFMRLAPDVSSSTSRNLLYFNGFGAVGGPAATTLNPNSATLKTAVAAAPFLPIALFGVWKDCNQDGFVGMGDNGALEYRTELLPTPAVCPPGTPDAARPWLVRNDGQWVVEFVPVGYDDITTAHNENALTINDTAARVWADWGLPADVSSPVCATYPAPRGSFRSTGGLLGYADCLLGHRGIAAVNDAAHLAGQPGLGFSDAPPGQPERSASPLNVANPWGAEGDAALVHVFRCDSGTPVVVRDPTGGALDAIADDQGNIASATVRPVSPAADPRGSPAGTVNATEAALDDCDRSDAGEVVDLDGRRAGSDGDLPYSLEGGAASSAPGQRRARTDHVFTFEEGSRGDALGLALGSRTREHAGTGVASVTGFWVGSSVGTMGRNSFVSRHGMAAEPVSFLTYYAHVSDVAIVLHDLQTPGASSRYGNEGCSSGAFECDPARWWVDASGADVTPRDARLGVDPADPTVPARIDATRIGVRIGQPYSFRDIDCIDASMDGAREADAHWGRLSGTACPRPPP